MKKYLAGFIALILAFSATAFTNIENSKKVSLHWYHRNAADTYVADGVGTDPNYACTSGLTICDKGFTTSQDPSKIKDNTPANQTRFLP